MTEKTNRKSDVDSWIEKSSAHQIKALEKASKHFTSDDSLTVHTLEAIYGKESSFGLNKRKRGMEGAAGDFQIEKKTAKRLGLTVSEKNDQRFDVDDSAEAAAKYLKTLDNLFKKASNLGLGLRTIPIKDGNERKKFSIASYNGGEGTIALAQREAKKANANSLKWDVVKGFIDDTGVSKSKSAEIREYVEKVLEYENEFSEKSQANKKRKDDEPSKLRVPQSEDGHWITKMFRRIFIAKK